MIVSIVYFNSWAVPELQIYNGDPRYPTAAHEHKMGAVGVVQMSIKGPDQVWNVRTVVSMGSPALDDSMVKAAKDVVTEAIKNRDDRHSITASLAVMFMPDYLPAPARSNGTSMVVPAFTNILLPEASVVVVPAVPNMPGRPARPAIGRHSHRRHRLHPPRGGK